MTPDDIKKINELIGERDRLKSGLEIMDDKDHKKADSFNAYIGGSPYGGHHFLCLTLAREQLLYHIKERLFHVELALKTYGVEA